MTGTLRTVGVILAAGRSSRFGPSDKLLADLAGRPLVTHAGRAMAQLKLAALGAVCRLDVAAMLCPPFDPLPVAPGTGQSASLRVAVDFARACKADRLLVGLGDMPFVTQEDLERVCARAGAREAAAVSDGTRPMPPACIPAAAFDALDTLEGDAGARSILRSLLSTQLVRVPLDRLLDVDTEDDLIAAQARPDQQA